MNHTSRMGNMILGTVQLGIPYGINNTNGKPDVQEAMGILDCAYQNGVGILDTASGYGDSEKIIGQYIRQYADKSRFEICTKLPIDIEAVDIFNYYEKSREKLCVNELFVYYIHRFEQCKNQRVIQQLVYLRNKGHIKHIGISIYQPDELEYIINHLSSVVDVVQIPFSVFDNVRWTKNDLLFKVKEKGIYIYARSIFLQGLIFISGDSELCRKRGITNQILQLQDIAKSMGIQVAQLAMNYINSVNEIEAWLIGCETVEQLQRNINYKEKTRCLEKNIVLEIEKISRSLDDSIIDPRRWGK